MKALLERNQPLPRWVEDCPDLGPGEELFLQAFFELSTERAIGWATGPIPNSKMVEWGERAGLDSTTMRLFTRVLKTMDDAYLTWANQERKAASND